MNTIRQSISFLCIVLLASCALAQPGPGGGQGMGPGTGGGFRFNQENTPGWMMMTQEERTAHHQRMMSMRSYDECRTYMEEHRKLMQERAQQKGVNPPMGRADMCERMLEAGRFR